MGLFNRPFNQKVRLNADQAPEGVTFTTDQFTTLIHALGLEEATADEVVAAVAALAEQANSKQDDGDTVKDVAANRSHGVNIDQHVWRDMKRAVERGLTLDQQEHRLAAEQTVDQAIRLGKASPTAREHWIAAYQKDPDTTVHALNRGTEIPRMEVGYGIAPGGDGEDPEPAGWVR